jgi:hypothetical protein
MHAVQKTMTRHEVVRPQRKSIGFLPFGLFFLSRKKIARAVSTPLRANREP